MLRWLQHNIVWVYKLAFISLVIVFACPESRLCKPVLLIIFGLWIVVILIIVNVDEISSLRTVSNVMLNLRLIKTLIVGDSTVLVVVSGPTAYVGTFIDDLLVAIGDNVLEGHEESILSDGSIARILADEPRHLIILIPTTIVSMLCE